MPALSFVGQQVDKVNDAYPGIDPLMLCQQESRFPNHVSLRATLGVIGKSDFGDEVEMHGEAKLHAGATFDTAGNVIVDRPAVMQQGATIQNGADFQGGTVTVHPTSLLDVKSDLTVEGEATLQGQTTLQGEAFFQEKIHADKEAIFQDKVTVKTDAKVRGVTDTSIPPAGSLRAGVATRNAPIYGFSAAAVDNNFGNEPENPLPPGFIGAFRHVPDNTYYLCVRLVNDVGEEKWRVVQLPDELS